MIINKAYKFRIYPNDNQKQIINQTFGCARLIYNYGLNKKQQAYEKENKNITCYDLIKEIPNLYTQKPFLKEIDSRALRCSLFNLDNAYNKFFKEKKGFPKYKSKYGKNSYRTNCIRSSYKGKEYENIKLDLKNKLLTIPKIKDIKIRGYRKLTNIEGRIINVTISKEKDNKYYASIVYEQDIIVKPVKTTKIIGLDLGIKDLVITSDYEKYENKKVLEKYEKRIKLYQRRLSKKIKASNNYYKLKQKLARLYTKIKNARKYMIHEITKKITNENDIIVIESLKLKNMIEKSRIAKALTDASLSEIIRQLEYKTKWLGKKLYKIDTYYPSTQICCICGYKNDKTKNLSVREYECPSCHNNLDRDINASINIMFEGIKQYMKEVTT